jgi:hypothetical protein
MYQTKDKERRDEKIQEQGSRHEQRFRENSLNPGKIYVEHRRIQHQEQGEVNDRVNAFWLADLPHRQPQEHRAKVMHEAASLLVLRRMRSSFLFS